MFEVRHDRSSGLCRVVYLVNGMFTHRFQASAIYDTAGTLYYIYIFGLLFLPWSLFYFSRLVDDSVVALTLLTVAIPLVPVVSILRYSDVALLILIL